MAKGGADVGGGATDESGWKPMVYPALSFAAVDVSEHAEAGQMGLEL